METWCAPLSSPPPSAAKPPVPPSQVTGSSDSTLRQWDLTTGQCVQTMDILWAISNPLPTSSVLYPASSYSPSTSDPFSNAFSTASPPSTPRKAASLRRQSSLFESPGGMGQIKTQANYADGSWELYDDFVGSVMFWGYALASGTKDGCVRMWDSAFPLPPPLPLPLVSRS